MRAGLFTIVPLRACRAIPILQKRQIQTTPSKDAPAPIGNSNSRLQELFGSSFGSSTTSNSGSSAFSPSSYLFNNQVSNEARLERETVEMNGKKQRLLARKWQAGDIYTPKALTPLEVKKYKAMKNPSRDIFDALGIDPIDAYKVGFSNMTLGAY